MNTSSPSKSFPIAVARRPDFSGRKSPPALKSEEFRLVGLSHRPEVRRAELSCYRSGQVFKGWVRETYFSQLEALVGQTVRIDFEPALAGYEPVLEIHRIEPVNRPANPLATLMPGWLQEGQSPQIQEIDRLVCRLAPAYRDLIVEIFSSDAVLQAFLNRPASLGHHHSRVGGLLEHTLEVVQDCERSLVASHGANADLVLTAALLHDIGKCVEYQPSGFGRFSRSHVGELEMHKLIGVRMVNVAASRLGMDEICASEIVHCIAACNGSEYMGLPRQKMYEAHLVQTADSRSSFHDLCQHQHFSTLAGMSHRWQASEPKQLPTFSSR